MAITPLETLSLVGSHGRGTWALLQGQRRSSSGRSGSVGIPTRMTDPGISPQWRKFGLRFVIGNGRDNAPPVTATARKES